MSMNVSTEANAAFMLELKRTDKPRHTRLMENMRGLAASPRAGTCAYSMCDASTAHLRAGTLFCSELCKKKAYRRDPRPITQRPRRLPVVMHMTNFLSGYKSFLGCEDCQNEYFSGKLHFDHVRGLKLFELSQHSGRSMGEVIAELLKCEVRCGSCHAKRHSKIASMKVLAA